MSNVFITFTSSYNCSDGVYIVTDEYVQAVSHDRALRCKLI